MKKKEHRVREFIINNVSIHASDIASFTANHFSLTRQAINLHLKNLVKRKILTATGNTRNKSYKLNPLKMRKTTYAINKTLAEDTVWRKDVLPCLLDCPENSIDILHHAFTEMFNNAIDHSGGANITVHLLEDAKYICISIMDDGIGIFENITDKFKLADEKHAVFELTKGKLTTAPHQHSGEGIFFTSRMVDFFAIESGKVGLSHVKQHTYDWVRDTRIKQNGTDVVFRVDKNSKESVSDIFLEFAPGDSFSFNKTVIPINLVEYDEIKLVSRSQAKRVLKRVDKFKIVALDFDKIGYIGQGFADEIFRVFVNAHPEIKIVSINTCKRVNDMICHVQGK